MATWRNAQERIQKLVDEGWIYTGQPDDRMETILRSESRKWRCRDREGSSRFWGSGPNEDLASMLATAQTLVYGKPVTTERYNEMGRGLFEAASRIDSCTRGGGSPYAVGFEDIVSYVQARVAAGETPAEVADEICTPSDYSRRGWDSRRIHDVMVVWAELQKFGFTVKEATWIGNAPDMTSVWTRHAEEGIESSRIRRHAMSHEWASRAIHKVSGRVTINRPQVSPGETREILNLRMEHNMKKRSIFMLWWVATGVVSEAERLSRLYSSEEEAMTDVVAFVRLRAETRERFHKVDGPAVQVGKADLWFLHGVCVPRWLVTTDEEQIDPRRVLTERNAQVRAEIVRKVGVERVCFSLRAEVIDQAGEYQLLKLVIEDREARFLRMQNRSMPELYHVEGLPPHVNTLRDAFRFRNQREKLPCVIT